MLLLAQNFGVQRTNEELLEFLEVSGVFVRRQNVYYDKEYLHQKYRLLFV